MKRFLSFIVTFALINLYLTLPALSATKSVDVKSGVRIPVIVPIESTSKEVTAGQKINALVEDDVQVDGVVIFKKDSPATLNVSDVKKARCLGIPGEIYIVNGEVIDAKGERHLIEYTRKVVGEEKTYPKVCLGVSLFFLWPLALVGFVKGGQAKVNPHATIDVSLKNDFNFVSDL